MHSDYFSSEEFLNILHRYQNISGQSSIEYFDVDDVIDLSDYYMDLGLVHEAINALEYGLQSHPNSAQIKIVLAGIEISQNNYVNAKHIMDGLNDGELINDFHYVNAQLSLTIYANYDDANTIFNKWLDLEFKDIENDKSLNNPNDLKRDCYIHIITSVRELVEDDSIKNKLLDYWINHYIDTFSDDDFGTFDKDLNVADLCRYENLLECCERIFLILLKNLPYLESGWTILASTQYSLGKYEESNESVDFALAVFPDDLNAIMVKAHSSFALNRFDIALYYFKQYKERTKASVLTDETDGLKYCECDLYIGITLWKLGEITESKKYVEQAIRWNENLKDDIETYSWNCKDIAEWLIALGLYNDAITVIDKGLLIQPVCIEFLQVKAEILLRLNNNEAYIYLEKSINLAENKLNAILSAGLRLLNSEYYKESIDYFDRALDYSDNPNHTHAYAFLAYSHYKNKDVNMFIHYLKIACKLCPNVLKMFFENVFPNIPPEDYYDYIVGPKY